MSVPRRYLPSRVHDDSPRVLQAVTDQSLVHLSVEFGDFDGVSKRVSPIDVPTDPINGHSFGRLQSGDQCLNGGSVIIGSMYGSVGDVTPVNQSVETIDVQTGRNLVRFGQQESALVLFGRLHRHFQQ